MALRHLEVHFSGPKNRKNGHKVVLTWTNSGAYAHMQHVITDSIVILPEFGFSGIAFIKAHGEGKISIIHGSVG